MHATWGASHDSRSHGSAIDIPNGGSSGAHPGSRPSSGHSCPSDRRRDLQFPHHENELAQSEAAACGCERDAAPDGADFVRFWVHNGFVNVDAEKMVRLPLHGVGMASTDPWLAESGPISCQESVR